MRKFITFLFLFFATVALNAQVNTTRQLTKIFDKVVGSKTKYSLEPVTKFGGKVYDSLIVTVPYGDCPLFTEGPLDSTAIRYGSHAITVEVTNDSSDIVCPVELTHKADSVYVELYLNFHGVDGSLINTGKVLSKGWTVCANSTYNIAPNDIGYATYMMRQEYFRATLTIKIYLGYKKTPCKVRVYKRYRNDKG